MVHNLIQWCLFGLVESCRNEAHQFGNNRLFVITYIMGKHIIEKRYPYLDIFSVFFDSVVELWLVFDGAQRPAAVTVKLASSRVHLFSSG